MGKTIQYEFCMKQFKPAIAALALLLVLVMAWTTWHCVAHPQSNHFQLIAATQAPAPPILVKDKMLHPYWGNCNKCHVTTNAGKPISKVMAGPPITIKQPMPHKYWGNCLLCHKLTDGFQAPANKKAAQTPAQAAALNLVSERTFGLKLQSVTAQVMQQFGLANEDGVLVLQVSPNSIGAAAGLKNGDEIIRVGNTRLDTVNDFIQAVNSYKPGDTVKLNIYRGTRTRNLFMELLGNGVQAAAAAPMTQNQIETMAEQLNVPKTQQAVTQALNRQKQTQLIAATAPHPQAPMTQNQIETMAEQLNVPKTQQAVTQALNRQKQGQPAAVVNSGKVAVAASGPGLGYLVAHQFGTSPYFVIYDPVQNGYGVVSNPNANDFTGHGVQTSHYMVDMGAGNVVAGSFSQDAVNSLHTLRLNVFGGVTGTVQDAVNAYLAHKLLPLNTVQPTHMQNQTMQAGPYSPGAVPGQPMVVY